MKNLNFRFAFLIIALSVLLGFFMNYRNGLSWTESVADMTKPGKVITYTLLFVAILVWKNRKIKS